MRELMAAPRRQAERLSRAGGAAMIADAQIAEALARLPDYLGGHVR